MILKTHCKNFTNNQLIIANNLLNKQPLLIQNQWIEIAASGKFEPDKAILACKNWPKIIDDPFFRPKKIVDTFNNLTPSISTLKKYQSEMIAALILCKIIKDTAAFFNVGGSINDTQVKQTAVLIIDTYHFLNITDFILCFKMAKTGKFGKLYDRLDGTIILSWLNEYNELRLQEAQIHSEKKSAKEKEKSLKIDSAIYQALKKCIETEDKPAAEDIKPQRRMTNQEFEEKRINDLNSLKCMYKKEDYKEVEKKTLLNKNK